MRCDADGGGEVVGKCVDKRGKRENNVEKETSVVVRCTGGGKL